MSSRQRIVSAVLLGPVVLGLSVAGFSFRARAAVAQRWQELGDEVRSLAAVPEGEASSQELVSYSRTAAGDQVGHVRLGNGEIWRFAFRSHHYIVGEESYAVFAGPSETYRVRGSYFCCEVELPGEAMPEDGAAFVAFLRDTHPLVESVE